jgi:hypothetical protein
MFFLWLLALVSAKKHLCVWLGWPCQVFTYHHMLDSEKFIVNTIREQGPFDGICGFSQGGAMASVMVALQRAGLALQVLLPICLECCLSWLLCQGSS